MLYFSTELRKQQCGSEKDKKSEANVREKN